MKANKAIWAGVLSAATALVTILTTVQPYLPHRFGAGVAIILLVATPIVVYLVPNFERIDRDAEQLVHDAKTGDIIGMVKDGSIFLRQDVAPALATDSRIKITGSAAKLADGINSAAKSLGDLSIDQRVAKAQQIAKAAEDAIVPVATEAAKVLHTPISPELAAYNATARKRLGL